MKRVKHYWRRRKLEPATSLLIGLADANIGDTIALMQEKSYEKLKGISIDEPTLSMVFSVN